uniref:6-phosphofructo-2-kinase / fructose-2,6-bisphosphatase n=1 Tax=Tetraselmis sp. GSL018 TaxID=582737 RepID=A0A061SGZ3_9CHLO
MWEFWRSSSRKLRREGGSPEPAASTTRKGSSFDNKEKVADVSAEAAAEVFSPARRLSNQVSPRKSPEHTHVDFKDLKLPLEDPEEEDEQSLPAEAGGAKIRKKIVEKHKLIIVLVGLPGRGKTFLCNKLCLYLNWLGHKAQHFNVGYYRRKQNLSRETQDAAFFDKDNPVGQEKRAQALREALDDMLAWLSQEHSQVAIFDATNSTEERRRYLVSKFHGTWQYMFLESVCNDPAVLESNYRYKMMFSPDYSGVDQERAIDDFKERIRRYEAVYETITDRNVHYIKLINMVTGRGHLDINRISGYIPGKIVFYLMQVCKAGMARTRKIWLSRHGESEYNLKELLGGDSGLTAQGWEYAQTLPEIIFDRMPLSFDEGCMPVSVWTSTLKRTIQTAEFLPFPKLRWKALDEIHAGQFDSHSYKQIAEGYPEEYAARKANKLSYRYPNGESYLDVIQRLEPVVIEIERERECVIVIAHQAILRALYGYFTNKPLSEIPTLEIPLHTVIELTPKPDGTMTEERFCTGIKTTQQKMAEAEAANAVPPPPVLAAKAGDSTAGSSPASAPPAILPRSPSDSRSLGSLSGVGYGSFAVCRSLNDLQLQNVNSLEVPALSQSKQWAESSANPAKKETIETSDERPDSGRRIREHDLSRPKEPSAA